MKNKSILLVIILLCSCSKNNVEHIFPDDIPYINTGATFVNVMNKLNKTKNLAEIDKSDATLCVRFPFLGQGLIRVCLF